MTDQFVDKASGDAKLYVDFLGGAFGTKFAQELKPRLSKSYAVQADKVDLWEIEFHARTGTGTKPKLLLCSQANAPMADRLVPRLKMCVCVCVCVCGLCSRGSPAVLTSVLGHPPPTTQHYAARHAGARCHQGWVVQFYLLTKSRPHTTLLTKPRPHTPLATQAL